MKIKLIENNINDIKADIEIIFINDLDNCSDKEILETIDFKAKDEACVLLAESKKYMLAMKKLLMIQLQLHLQQLLENLHQLNMKVQN